MLDSFAAIERRSDSIRFVLIFKGEAALSEIGEVQVMALTIEDVEHVASLARLGLSGDEKIRLRDQLSAILESMDLLNEIDVSNIPPTAQVIALANVMRDDVVRPSLTQAQALSNAPRQNEGFFEVDSPLGGAEEAS